MRGSIVGGHSLAPPKELKISIPIVNAIVIYKEQILLNICLRDINFGKNLDIEGQFDVLVKETKITPINTRYTNLVQSISSTAEKRSLTNISVSQTDASNPIIIALDSIQFIFIMRVINELTSFQKELTENLEAYSKRTIDKI